MSPSWRYWRNSTPQLGSLTVGRWLSLRSMAYQILWCTGTALTSRPATGICLSQQQPELRGTSVGVADHTGRIVDRPVAHGRESCILKVLIGENFLCRGWSLPRPSARPWSIQFLPPLRSTICQCWQTALSSKARPVSNRHLQVKTTKTKPTMTSPPKRPLCLLPKAICDRVCIWAASRLISALARAASPSQRRQFRRSSFHACQTLRPS